MPNAVKFKFSQNLARQPGERARIKVVQGPDYGSTFVITGERASVGRGEESDIMILDLKASRNHAEFAQSGSLWLIRDLGSANGILHNGKQVRQNQLRSGDTVAIGETVLEFIEASAGTRALASPAKSPSQVVLERKTARPASRSAPATSGDKRSKLVMGVVLAVGLVFLIDTGRTKYGSRSTDTGPRDGIAGDPVTPVIPNRAPDSVTPNSESPDNRQAAETFVRSGLREFRERNYVRAKLSFENALQVLPGHAVAIRYSQRCTQEIEIEVKRHLEEGKKSVAAGRLRDARIHFESVTRLRRADPADPALLEAKENLDLIRKKLTEREAG